MSTRLYPLYKRGNPQLRIFLPNFWMKIIRPQEPIPPNMVTFQTSIEMTEYDVRNYLEKIYKIPIVEIKLTIKQGKIRRAYGEKYLVKDDDYKEALVTMPRDCKFTYPEFVELASKQKEDITKEVKKTLGSSQFQPHKDLPPWFS